MCRPGTRLACRAVATERTFQSEPSNRNLPIGLLGVTISPKDTLVASDVFMCTEELLEENDCLDAP